MDAARDFTSWVRVSSSNVESVAWWADRRTGVETFGIRFLTSDLTYHFLGVPESVYKALLAAPSKGTFFAARIKKKYAWKKFQGKK